MSGPPNLELAVQHCIERKPFRSPYDRGYSSDGEAIYIDGHTIAQWIEGAIRMYYADARWLRTRMAIAFRRVQVALSEEGYLGNERRRMCLEHEDCRGNRQLGRACAISRFGHARGYRVDRATPKRGT